MRLFVGVCGATRVALGARRTDGVAPSAIGVVSRTPGDTAAVEHALAAADVPWSELGKGGKGVGVGTMHASKGLEFARLAVVGVSADRVPLPLAVTSEAEDAAQHALDLLRERCLLYVACTRARDALVVSSSGAVSKFLADRTMGESSD